MQEPAPRLHLTPLLVRLALALILPMAVAFALDQALGVGPLLALLTALACIPLATVLVSKAALRDMDRIIALVAPPDPGAPDEIEPAGEGLLQAVGEPPAEPEAPPMTMQADGVGDTPAPHTPI